MGTRYHNLRSLVGLLDFHDEGLDAVAMAVSFRRNLFSRRQHSFRLAEVDEHIAVFHTLYKTREDIAFTALEFFVNHAAFCFTDALYNNLLSRLGCHTAKVSRRHFDFDDIAHFVFRANGTRLSQGNFRDFIIGILDNRLEGVHMIMPRITGQGNTNILGGTKVPLVSSNQGLLNGLK